MLKFILFLPKHHNQTEMIQEHIIHNIGTSFSHIVYDRFTMPWHYHEEYELILITSGGGKRFVGDYVDDFKPGDLVLLGANLPHYHMCYGLVSNDTKQISSCEVIQFTNNIFPNNIDSLEEFVIISDLLQRSRYGIKFTDPSTSNRIKKIMTRIDSLKGIKRVYVLMHILEILGKLPNYKLLTSPDYYSSINLNNTSNITNRVYKYLLENFKSKVSLKELSLSFGFNTTALCRYYKRRTQKSIFESLKEIRINFACKLLINSSLSISQIAYECGYDNISNFNRQFKSILGMTPSEYKNIQSVQLQNVNI